MNAVALKEACHSFAQTAAPYLSIRDDAHYDEALGLIESLLEEAGDSADEPLNAMIDMLSHAIEVYENRDQEPAGFEARAMNQPADLPEIGSKSMVSRVLSGKRNLNKNHIKALSRRFGIDPGLFF